MMSMSTSSSRPSRRLLKDRILDTLARRANVAQFVSFGPGANPKQRFSRVLGYNPNYSFGTPHRAILALLAESPEGRVNIRTYKPQSPRGWELQQGLEEADRVVTEVEKYARQGFYTIVNEAVDVDDGGISGVAESRVLEVAPGTTPRGVDQGDVQVAAMPRDLGLELLATVYGFRPQLDFSLSQRVEFSLHPLPRGYRHEHTIIWELSQSDADLNPPQMVWPNAFSRLLGDKAFGLLLADAAGFAVPKTTVISRKIAPFTFGRSTKTSEVWMRTCPQEFAPGVYDTYHRWKDPFQFLHSEDPTGKNIPSLLAQQGVPAKYSGALTTAATGKTTIEGVPSWGDRFMQGEQGPQPLPEEVESAVRELHSHLFAVFGPIYVEWVFDGQRVWVVQLRHETSVSVGQLVYPGSGIHEHRFPVARGLKELYRLIAKVQGTSDGIVLVGNVGITGHMAEALRRACIPSRIEPQ